jgi:hypothetical protein
VTRFEAAHVSYLSAAVDFETVIGRLTDALAADVEAIEPLVVTSASTREVEILLLVDGTGKRSARRRAERILHRTFAAAGVTSSEPRWDMATAGPGRYPFS